MLTSRLYREWIFAGPARTGKTVALLTGINHLITCDPGVCHITHMTEGTAEAWVDEELLPMIENSPELARRQGRGRSDRNILSKKFLGGAKLTIGPPTKSNLSGRTIRFVLFTDLDRMALTIGKEGSPFAMGAKRNETLGSRGMTAAESSPGHSVLDPEFVPQTPHQAPPCDGIMSLYNGGTRARFYWDCPECAGRFEAHFKYLHYDKSLSPSAAGEAAVMVCPHCGGWIAPRHKNEINRAGYWLHETATGGLDRIDSGAVLASARISYHLNGAAAAFATWARLVSKYETALQAFRETKDEELLRVTVNTDQGDPYLPRAMTDEGSLRMADLEAAFIDLPQGVAPAWAAFIVVSADVQGDRFDVQATAFGQDGRRALIDRYDITDPPPDAPEAGDRRIDPALYSEDWDALRAALIKPYPVAGEDYALTAVALGCDFHGKPGVSDNATKFWQARRADGEAKRYYMIRGYGGLRVDGRLWYKAPTRKSDGGKARDIKLLNVATDKFKDTTFAGLRRTDGGPGSYQVGAWLPEPKLREFMAEKLTAKGWEPRPAMPRNESIDLSSYAQAVAEHLGLLRLGRGPVPPWAVGGAANLYAVALPEAGAPDPLPEKTTQRAARPRRISFLE